MKKNIFIFILFLIETLNLSAQTKSSVEYPDSVFNGKIDIVYVFEVNDDIDSIKSLSYDKDKLEVLANPCINTIKSYVTRNGKQHVAIPLSLHIRLNASGKALIVFLFSL